MISKSLAALAPLSIIAYLIADMPVRTDVGPLWVLFVSLGLSAVLIFVPRDWAQITARAIWWQALVLGVVIALAGKGRDGGVALTFCLGGGLALLLAPRPLGARQAGVFRPVAYHGLLAAIIAMALADAEALLLWGAVALHDDCSCFCTSAAVRWSKAGPLFASALVMFVACIGVYRLRLWGLLLNTIANVVIAVAALAGWLCLPGPIRWGLAATALAQLVLPLPLWRAIARGAAPDKQGPTWIEPLVIGALLFVGVLVSVARL